MDNEFHQVTKELTATNAKLVPRGPLSVGDVLDKLMEDQGVVQPLPTQDCLGTSMLQKEEMGLPCLFLPF